MATSDNILTFKEWSSSNPSIPFDKRMQKYDEYLKNVLVTEVITKEETQANETVEMYKSFLRRITVIYNEDPDIIQLNNLDLDDPKQLASAIPIFANKIKDIAIFYGRKRRELKDKKVEFSTKGSIKSLDRTIRNLFINRYSVNPDYQDPTIDDIEILEGIAPRQDIIDNLDIEVVEKYNVTAQHPKPNN